MSKSCLAPLKAVSIPRLELLGALLGLRFTRQVCSTLKIPTNGVTYWVDSMNVGYWIQGQSREYKLFIAHCVGEIHEFSAPNHWHYVPTKCKPCRCWNKRPDSRRVSKMQTYGGMGQNFRGSQDKTGQSASLSSQCQCLMHFLMLLSE